MRKLLVVVVLLFPSVAAADWTFKAPKGWKRNTSSETRHLEAERKKAGGEAQFEARHWRASEGDPKRQASAELMIVPAGMNDMTVQELADMFATGTAKALVDRGYELRSSKAPIVKKQGIAAQLLESSGHRVYIEVRVARTAKGALHALQVRCGDSPTQDLCKQAMSTIKLSPR
jgi:hypothetical protein